MTLKLDEDTRGLRESYPDPAMRHQVHPTLGNHGSWVTEATETGLSSVLSVASCSKPDRPGCSGAGGTGFVPR